MTHFWISSVGNVSDGFKKTVHTYSLLRYCIFWGEQAGTEKQYHDIRLQKTTSEFSIWFREVEHFYVLTPFFRIVQTSVQNLNNFLAICKHWSIYFIIDEIVFEIPFGVSKLKKSLLNKTVEQLRLISIKPDVKIYFVPFKKSNARRISTVLGIQMIWKSRNSNIQGWNVVQKFWSF